MTSLCSNLCRRVQNLIQTSYEWATQKPQLSLDQLLALPKEKLKEAFSHSLPLITNQVKEADRDLLKMQAEKVVVLDQGQRRIKKQLRTLLLRLVQSRPTEKFVKDYKEYLNHTLGNRQFSSSDRNRTIIVMRAILKPNSEAQTQELGAFFEAVIQHRRHYLTRYSSHKFERYVPQNEGPLLDLLRLNWLTGFTSGVLHNLPKTDFSLLPTGELRKRKIILFSGELQKGATLFNVNNDALSGTQLDGFTTTLNYASGSFVTNPAKEREIIAVNLLLRHFSEQETEIVGAGEIIRTAFAIRRLRALGPEEFHLDFDVRAEVQRLLKEFKTIYPQAEKYASSKPYWSKKLIEMEDALADLQDALESDIPVLSSEQKKMILDPFTVVAGSFTLSAEPLEGERRDEYVVKRAAKLGRDIQVLFVPSERIKQVKAWLAQHGLDVAVFSIDILYRVGKINKIVSPKLAEVISLKKLESISSFHTQ